jgi:hypothetical protein
MAQHLSTQRGRDREAGPPGEPHNRHVPPAQPAGGAALRALGKRVGDTVTVGTGRHRRTLRIVGTVTLPSIGLALADHISLGRGAMLDDSTLLALQGLSPQLTTEEEQQASVSDPALPSAVAIDLAPGTDAAPWRRESPAPTPARPRAEPTGSPGCWARRAIPARRQPAAAVSRVTSGMAGGH